MSRLVTLAASVFELSCGKTDRHTDKWSYKPYPPLARVTATPMVSFTICHLVEHAASCAM